MKTRKQNTANLISASINYYFLIIRNNFPDYFERIKNINKNKFLYKKQLFHQVTFTSSTEFTAKRLEINFDSKTKSLRIKTTFLEFHARLTVTVLYLALPVERTCCLRVEKKNNVKQNHKTKSSRFSTNLKNRSFFVEK